MYQNTVEFIHNFIRALSKTLQKFFFSFKQKNTLMLMFRLSIESSHPEQDFDMFPDNVFSATVWVIPLISIFFIALSEVVSFRFETILMLF